MVTPIHEFIPTLIIGRRRYIHYPIRPMSRQEAEEILRQPWMRHRMIIRTSPNAQQDHPDLYYVISYLRQDVGLPIHLIVTRQFYAEHQGRHPIYSFLPHFHEYQLPLLPNHPAFQETRVEEEDPMEEAPQPREENERPPPSE